MSSFDNVDMAMSSMMSQLDNHVISDPYSILSEATAADRSNSIFRKDPEVYLDFLESWDFVQGLIDSFASPLKEVLNKNQIKVSFKSSELSKYTDWVNNVLLDIDLKHAMMDSLSSVIYRGTFFKLLSYNKETRKFHLVDVDKPWSTSKVNRLGKPMGYLRNKKFVDYSEGVFGCYRSHVTKRVTLDKVTSKTVKDKVIEDIGKEYDKRMESEITVYTHSVGRSVFYGQATKLFQIYLNDFVSQFLALKDSVRQDLLAVTVSALPKKTTNTAKVVQSIEEAVNQGANLLVQQDPYTLLNQVVFSLFNNVRVLPMVDSYSSITNIDLANLKDKRQQLQNETDELKRQVISNLSIPEELQSGSGNRWEILSRSDKFLTAINSYISIFDSVVKSSVVAILRSVGRYCTEDDIAFSFINDTPLQSQMSRNKAGLFIDSLRDSINAINGLKMTLATGFVDPEGAVQDFLSQIQSWNLPFSSSYLSTEEIIKGLTDPNSPTSQLTGEI